MKNYFNRIKVIFACVCGALFLNPVYSFAHEKEETDFTGCYSVERGKYKIAKAVFLINQAESPREIGKYKMVLTKMNNNGEKEKRILSGPLLGHPYEQVGGMFLTRHILGTFSRIGTMSSNEGIFSILNASCPDSEGNPQFVEATEEMGFTNAVGTGRLAGVVSGSVLWRGTVNACDDPTNRIGDFKVVSGEICFK